MRVNELIKKHGFFWIPSNPEIKIPGILTISDGARIELDIIGLFVDNDIFLEKNMDFKRILGDIEDYGFVTLDDCFYIHKKRSFGGISKSKLLVNKAFLKVAYDNNEEIHFNKFKFSIEGIDEWVGLSGINVNNDYENKNTLIGYTPQEEICIPLKNSMKLIITFEWSIPGFPILKEAVINQKTYFKLLSDTPLPINEFITVSNKITTFLCFAIDKIVCIESVSGKNNDTEFYIPLYYRSLTYTENKPVINRNNMLFTFSQINKDAEKIMNKWLDANEEISPSLNLYFSSQIQVSKYLETRFLFLVQGLETYHRRTSNEFSMDENDYNQLTEVIINACPEEHKTWLKNKLKYGNEISLSRRLKKIIEPFKNLFGANNDERKKYIRLIVNTRNYLTHYDDSLKNKICEGIDLFPLCLKMEAIFQLHLLQVLGFSQDEIQSIYKYSLSLKNKLNN